MSGNIVHWFECRKVAHLDEIGEDLWEVITPDGERVATSTVEEHMFDLEVALNMALTDANEHEEVETG